MLQYMLERVRVPKPQIIEVASKPHLPNKHSSTTIKTLIVILNRFYLLPLLTRGVY